METIEEKVAVHRAWLEGKQIQVVNRQKTVWNDTDKPAWDWIICTYRVKPEPMKPEPVKPAVAYAYRYKQGNIYWADNEHVYSDKKYYTRAPEFDIVEKLPDSSE